MTEELRPPAEHADRPDHWLTREGEEPSLWTWSRHVGWQRLVHDSARPNARMIADDYRYLGPAEWRTETQRLADAVDLVNNAGCEVVSKEWRRQIEAQQTDLAHFHRAVWEWDRVVAGIAELESDVNSILFSDLPMCQLTRGETAEYVSVPTATWRSCVEAALKLDLTRSPTAFSGIGAVLQAPADAMPGQDAPAAAQGAAHTAPPTHAAPLPARALHTAPGTSPMLCLGGAPKIPTPAPAPPAAAPPTIANPAVALSAANQRAAAAAAAGAGFGNTLTNQGGAGGLVPGGPGQGATTGRSLLG